MSPDPDIRQADDGTWTVYSAPFAGSCDPISTGHETCADAAAWLDSARERQAEGRY